MLGTFLSRLTMALGAMPMGAGAGGAEVGLDVADEVAGDDEVEPVGVQRRSAPRGAGAFEGDVESAPSAGQLAVPLDDLAAVGMARAPIFSAWARR